MDSSNFVQIAACLNNEAVLLLTTRYRESFVTAFQMLKNALDIFASSPTCSNSSSCVPDMCQKSPQSQQSEQSPQSQSRLSPSYLQLYASTTTSINLYEKSILHTNQTNYPKMIPALHMSVGSINIPKFYGSNQTEQYFIYDRVLAFNYPNSLSPGNLPFYCSVVVFNMAVMVHLNNENKETEYYHKALKCYKLVLSLLEEAEESTESGVYDHIEFLRIATLNNIAMTHHDLCQFQEERKFLDKVMLSLTSNDFVASTVFDKICCEGFLRNAMSALVSLPHAPSA